MRKPSTGTAVISAVAVCLGVLLAAQAAKAANLPRTDAQFISPAVVNGQSGFYTEDQIDEVWGAVVAHYPAPLPKGYEFPKLAPAFFHPGDATNPLFEVGLPDMIAATYWRCSWLDAHINAPAALRVSSQELGDALVAFGSLPSVAEVDDRDLSPEILTRVARDRGLADMNQALFALDCGGFER